MAASVETRVYTGAGPSEAAAANLRFKNTDDNLQTVANPGVIPAAGTNYSYWKTIALYCTVAPSVDINNVTIYSDSNLSWGTCVLYVGDQVTDTYDQATGSGDSGDEVVANHSQISSKTDMDSHRSWLAKSIAESAAWASSPGADKRVTGYVVFQVDIPSDATVGTQVAETLVWTYDEV